MAPLEPDALPVTVPGALHAAVAHAASAEFAASYLCGAVLVGGVLHPRTETARKRLRDTAAAVLALNEAGVRLGEAIPSQDRMTIAAAPAPRPETERRTRR
jgi:hypothetical protein